MSEQQVKSKPWYRYPIVWMVIGLPLTAVVGGIHLLFLVSNDPNDVIQDNYYKEGLAINQRFAEDDLAKSLGLTADVSVSGDTMRIKLVGPSQPFLHFSLFHIKDSDQDIAGALAQVTGSGNESEYVYSFKEVPVGRWYLEIKGDDGNAHKVWRLKGRLDLPLKGSVTLIPAEN